MRQRVRRERGAKGQKRGQREQVKWMGEQRRQEERGEGGCVGGMREIKNEARGVRE